MDFRINYFFERNCTIFVNITRKGRNYDRPCKIDSYDHPCFRFRGKIWRPDCRLRMAFER